MCDDPLKPPDRKRDVDRSPRDRSRRSPRNRAPFRSPRRSGPRGPPARRSPRRPCRRAHQNHQPAPVASPRARPGLGSASPLLRPGQDHHDLDYDSMAWRDRRPSGQAPARLLQPISPSRSKRSMTRSANWSRPAPALLEICGSWAADAAKIVGETADVRRFKSKDAFARYSGTAPLPVWSSDHPRHRLSRVGNRQLNCTIHRIALTQAHWHPDARAYLERRKAAGDTRKKRSASSSAASPTSSTGPGTVS